MPPALLPVQYRTLERTSHSAVGVARLVSDVSGRPPGVLRLEDVSTGAAFCGVPSLPVLPLPLPPNAVVAALTTPNAPPPTVVITAATRATLLASVSPPNHSRARRRRDRCRGEGTGPEPVGLGSLLGEGGAEDNETTWPFHRLVGPKTVGDPPKAG